MCRFGVYLKKLKSKSTVTDSKLYESFIKMRHGGPDKTISVLLEKFGVFLTFHRLAITGIDAKGDQPFVDENNINDYTQAHIENKHRLLYVMCNGEIYNFKSLCEKYSLALNSSSDCEVILHLYKLIGLDAMIKELDGEFSFCIVNINKKTKEVKLFVGRDQAGTRMLHMTGSDDEVVITSEAKSSPFLDKGYTISQFMPRHYIEISNCDDKLYDPEFKKLVKWLDLRAIKPTIFNLEEAKYLLRKTIIKTVRSMTMGDRKFCCLLSGGLDSSLVAAILAEYCREHGVDLYTFSIGLTTGSTDRPFAELVSRHINSSHYHTEFTEEYCLEMLDKIPGIIESIDITSCRASLFQYLILKWISENTDFKIVFCGDGSDELFMSYKYCHLAPSVQAFHDESVRLVEDVHMFDGLRAGMCASACGLEIRFVFLAKELLELVFSIDPKLRMPRNGVEKWLLRESFAGTGYLPDEVLWRSKEALSDAVSTLVKSWYEMIRDRMELLYTDEELELSKLRYNHMPVQTKEALHYRKKFIEAFGDFENTQKVTPYYWLPKWVQTITGQVLDPSARTLEVYSQAYNTSDSKYITDDVDSKQLELQST